MEEDQLLLMLHALQGRPTAAGEDEGHSATSDTTQHGGSGSGGGGVLTVGALIVDVVVELIDEMTRGVAFELHRALKLGLLCPCFGSPPSQHKHRGIVENMDGHDVFGQPTSKISQEAFPCPKCGVSRAPAKFAPHLEKCMGMGRESRRVAASRSKAQSAESGAAAAPAATEDGEEGGADANDADWEAESGRARKGGGGAPRGKKARMA